MKRIWIATILGLAGHLLYAQNYNSLEIETLRCSNHKWQEVEYFVDGSWLPSPKLTSTNSAGCTVTGDVSYIESYRPFDGDPTTHAWLGYIEPPQESESIILTWNDRTVSPDSVRFTKPTYSQVMDFRIWGLPPGEGAEKVLLLDVADLASSGFATMTFPLEIVTDTLPPSVPGIPVVTGITPTSVSFTWNPSSDDRNAIFYQVIVDEQPYDTTTASAYLLGGLMQNTIYEIKIAAFDESGNLSAASDSVVVTTPLPDTNPPSDPSGLVLDSANSETLWFSWNASTDNEGVAGYPVILNGTIAGVADGTSFALPGLEEDSLYTIRILARDAAGNVSDGYAEASFQTSQSVGRRMKIGTGFWNIGWGGSGNDPFISGYNSFVVSENPWKEAFLEETAFYSNYRFMDYNNTNGSTVSHWNQRAHREDTRQNPVAYEWMIDLCNRQGVDLWLTIPHFIVNRDGMEGNDNHYVKKLAILVKSGVDMLETDLDNPEFADLASLTEPELIALGGIKTCEPLHPDLQFYIEYSNETWNHSFSQATYCDQEGQALGLDGDFYAQGRRFHAWAALRLFEAVDEVFGSGNPRIMRISAYQAVSPYQIQDHYSVYKDETLNPLQLFPDAFSPAPYFGNGVNGSDSDAVQQMISGSNGILSRTNSLKFARQLMQEELDNGYPVNKLIAYEGGQHLISNAQIMSRDPEIYTLYVRYLDSCSAYLDEMTHYVHSGTFSSGGAWGSKEYIGQEPAQAHKYRALRDWHFQTAVRPDSEPPSVPAGLSYTGVSEEGYTLHWNPSSDNCLVKSYTVRTGETTYREITDTSFTVTGLQPGRTYSNSVRAVDSTGNASAYSEMLEVTTLGSALYTVTFRVKNTISEDPVAGAEVSFDNRVLATDALGEAVFTEVGGGNGIPYAVEHPSHYAADGTVDLSDFDPIVEVYMEPLTHVDVSGPAWNLFPNPCTVTFRIEYAGNAALTIMDLSGNIRLQAADYRGEVISVEELPPGAYIAELDIAGEKLRKLLVRR